MVLLLVRVVRQRIWVVLLLVRIVLLQVVLLWWLLLLGPLVGAKAQMGEDAGDVVEHGSVHPLAFLGEVSVVHEVLANLVLLLA
jgi:hypothetical protein